MKISVIIPTYNRKNQVKRAINSVLNQTIKPDEIIVVDDGSTDDTTLFLKKNYNAAVQIVSQPHQGVAAARNTGIRSSSSSWIAFLDSDDWWLPEKLAKQTAYHKKHPELLISQTDDIWIRNGKRVNRRKYHTPQAGWIYNISLERCMISPSAVMINRKIFEEVGLFDETLPACEDYDLWLRITARYSVGLIKEKLVVKTGGHPDQLSQKHWGMDRFRIQALEKILQKPLTLEQKRETVKTLIEKLTILKNGSLKRGKYKEAYKYQAKLKKYQELMEKTYETAIDSS